MSVTLLAWQRSHSEPFMRREELAMSGKFCPTPSQNSLMPEPEPLASTIGVGKLELAPNCSATVVENGNTVEDPTMRISRATAGAATASAATIAITKPGFMPASLPERLLAWR
jgi:hypothetical protein